MCVSIVAFSNDEVAKVTFKKRLLFKSFVVVYIFAYCCLFGKVIVGIKPRILLGKCSN